MEDYYIVRRRLLVISGCILVVSRDPARETEQLTALAPVSRHDDAPGFPAVRILGPIKKGRCVPKKQRPRFPDDLTFVLEQLRRANLFNQLAKTIASRETPPLDGPSAGVLPIPNGASALFLWRCGAVAIQAHHWHKAVRPRAESLASRLTDSQSFCKSELSCPNEVAD
jgi:hypothetical protein